LNTEKQKIDLQIELQKNWREANPGIADADQHPSDEPKIYITKEMLCSPAYRSLSGKAMLAYQDFLAKRDMRPLGRRKKADGTKVINWHCFNNGQIRYPYSIAEKNGFSRRDFRNAIDELQIKGFIDITHLGKGGRKPETGDGDSTMYYLDTRWKEYDEVTQRAIRPPRNQRKRDTRQGMGWVLYWQRVRLFAAIGYIKGRCKQILSIKADTGLRLSQYPN
jgi:hypothetical protein